LGRVVIVGAGHAGGSAAALLRQFGWAGEIVLIGEEPTPPYQRPPLSKAFLKGETDADSLKLKADDFYPEHDIDLRTGVRVEGIDAGRRQVVPRTGESIDYDVLILATGSAARALPIPGVGLVGVQALRSLADAQAIGAALAPGRRLAVVGAGYVGLEVAASARALGAEVVVVERESRVLARVAAEPLSRFFEARHRAHDVEVLTGAQAHAFEDDGAGRVAALVLADCRRVACDVAVVGVGAAACDTLAVSAGLQCEGGVIVDETARSSDPAIYAIGDVSLRPMPLYGERRFRLESVPNALEQAKQAAAAITGRPAPPPEVPWFWSDQYDLKLQIAGVPFDSDRLVVRGDMDSGRFALFHLAPDGRLLCVEACNSPAEFMGGRQLIARRARPDPARLADPEVSMKLLAEAT